MTTPYAILLCDDLISRGRICGEAKALGLYLLVAKNRLRICLLFASNRRRAVLSWIFTRAGRRSMLWVRECWPS